MKIERIILRQIRMPLVHLFETSFGRTTGRDIILVEVVSDGVSGWGDGPVATAQVYESIGVAATPAGDVILLDAATYRVRALHAGTIDTLAGGALAQTLDGSGNAAGFLLPRAAAAAPDGSLLVAEAGGHALRRIRLP